MDQFDLPAAWNAIKDVVVPLFTAAASSIGTLFFKSKLDERQKLAKTEQEEIATKQASIAARKDEFSFLREQLNALKHDFQEALLRNEQLERKLDELELGEIKKTSQLRYAELHIADLNRAISQEPDGGANIRARLTSTYTAVEL